MRYLNREDCHMDYEEKTMKSEKKFIKGRLLIYELIQLNCQIKSTQKERL